MRDPDPESLLELLYVPPPSSTSSKARRTTRDDGGVVSPLTGRPWSRKYAELARKWSQMPVFKDRGRLHELASSIATNPVTVVVSGTGSGKTVIVPKLALAYALQLGRAKETVPTRGGEASSAPPPAPPPAPPSAPALQVAVTNPKRMIAYENAAFAAATLDVPLGGKHVGAAFRGAPPGSSFGGGDSALLFVTDGYLVAQSRSDPLFSRYAAVVIDEAHERTVQIDNLLFLLRRALASGRRPDLRVVIISATIDPALFTGYFEEASLETRAVEVSGAPNCPVEVSYRPPGSPSPRDVGVDMERLMTKGGGFDAVRAALAAGGPGEDTLFFVPTARDAEAGCKLLAAACSPPSSSLDPQTCARTKCATLYSKLSEERQREARSPTVELPYDRKIIFATNIAESSLTLPTLTAVIDSGLELATAWLPERHAHHVARAMSTRAQMKQRLGRVGRTRPGRCYRLYTERQMEEQPEYPDPSILTVDLADDFLAMLNERGATFGSVCGAYADFLTPPRPGQAASAASALSFYGLLDLVARRDTRANGNGQREGAPSSSPPVYVGAHFAEVDWSALVADVAASGGPDVTPAEGLRRVGRAYEESRITALGRLVLDVMKRLKLGLWNALLVVAGRAYDAEAEAIALACVLEEAGDDGSGLWKQQPQQQQQQQMQQRDAADTGGVPPPPPQEIVDEVLDCRDLLHPSSEHVSLLALYKAVAKLRAQGKAAKEGEERRRRRRKRRSDEEEEEEEKASSTGERLRALLNEPAWDRTEARIDDAIAKMRHFRIPGFAALVARASFLRLPFSASPISDALERSVLAARLYHVAVTGATRRGIRERRRRRRGGSSSNSKANDNADDGAPPPPPLLLSTTMTVTPLEGVPADLGGGGGGEQPPTKKMAPLLVRDPTSLLERLKRDDATVVVYESATMASSTATKKSKPSPSPPSPPPPSKFRLITCADSRPLEHEVF